MNENDLKLLKDMMDFEFRILNTNLKNLISETIKTLKTRILYESNKQMLIQRGILPFFNIDFSKFSKSFNNLNLYLEKNIC